MLLHFAAGPGNMELQVGRRLLVSLTRMCSRRSIQRSMANMSLQDPRCSCQHASGGT